MRTKEIIQDEIIRLLFAKVSKGEALDVTELLEFHKLTKELDSLKSAKDNPDRSAEPVNYFEIQEYTSDDYMKLEKETLVKLLMNCQKLLYGNQYAISNNHVEFSSSNQPVQSVKGEGERTADQEFAKIKMAIASIQAVYLKMNEDKTFIEANPSNHRIAEYVQFLLNDHKHSESKEQYPVDFLLWIGGQGLYYDKEEKKWFEVGEGGVVYKKSTDELFNHWSTVVTKR